MPIMGVGFTRVMSQSLSLLKTLANTAITRKTSCFSCFAKKNKEDFMQKVISTDKAPAAIGPYSQAIEVNGMVYTSGIIPVVPETGEIPEGSVAQAKQALTNLSNLLEAAGTNMDNVVKTTVFIKEMNDFSAINDVYKTFFTTDFPSRSCVEVARLPKDVMLEIEAIAIK